MTDIKLTREQQLKNECGKAWELYRLEKAARERAEAALQAQQQGAQAVESGFLGWVRRAAIEKLRSDDEVTGVMVHDEEQTDSVKVYLRPQPPSIPEPSELRKVAKRNLRSMIERGSDDKALMLKCLEELS